LFTNTTHLPRRIAGGGTFDIYASNFLSLDKGRDREGFVKQNIKGVA
jgi:hypothetical protein